MATNDEMKLFGFGGAIAMIAPYVDFTALHIPDVGADLQKDPYKITLVARDGSTITLSISDIVTKMAEEKS